MSQQETPQKAADISLNDDSELLTPTSPFYNLKGETKFITANEYANSQDYQDELEDDYEEDQVVLDDPFGETEEDPFAYEENENEDILEYQDYPEDVDDDEGIPQPLQKSNISFNTTNNTSFATNKTNTTFNTSYTSTGTNRTYLQSPSDSFISGRTTRTNRTTISVRSMAPCYEPLQDPKKRGLRRATLLLKEEETKGVVADMIPSLNIALLLILLLLAIVLYSNELHEVIRPFVRLVSSFLRRLNVTVWTDFDELEL